MRFSVYRGTDKAERMKRDVMSACPRDSSSTVPSSRLSGRCRLCHPFSCPPPHTLCFLELPHTWAQEGVRLARHTVAVQDILGMEAVLGQDRDLQGPFVQQGSWGRLRRAGPCLLGIPVEDILGVGSLEEVVPGPGSLEQLAHCLGTEGAAQNSSLGRRIT